MDSIFFDEANLFAIHKISENTLVDDNFKSINATVSIINDIVIDPTVFE